MQRVQTILIVCLALFATLTWAQSPLLVSSEPTVVVEETIELPPTSTFGEMSLEQALNRRRSGRDFKDVSLSRIDLGQLLWSAQGITDPDRGLRTAPSAGAIHPLRVHVVTGEGVFRYFPASHRLTKVRSGDLRKDVVRAAYNQVWMRRAGAILVFTAEFESMRRRYGEMAERFIDLEAGHAAQNVLLSAVSLDLAATPVGAFDDGVISTVLGLADTEHPVYLIAVGEPRSE